MKKIFTLFILLIPAVSFAEQTFHLNCKLLDQVIFSMEEGKLTKFGGFSKGIAKGENFQVKFKYFPGEDSFGFIIKIPGLLTGNYIGDSEQYVFSSDVETSFDDRIQFRSYKSIKNLFIHSDSIGYRDEWSYFDFSRYYKNDWQLIFNSRSLTTFTMGSANCMGMSKMYDDVLKSMRDIIE